MSEAPQDELQARWERLWAWGEDLDRRQAQLLDSTDEMEPELFDRALAVIQDERDRYGRQLESLKAELARREGDTDGTQGQP